MNITKEEAEALSSRATRHEYSEDFDSAFQLYLRATESFLHLYRTTSAGSSREYYKSSAERCLQRADQIKTYREITPVPRTPFSPESQFLALHASSEINGRCFEPWTDWVQPKSLDMFKDSEGDPPMSAEQCRHVRDWKRPGEISDHPVIFSDDFRADQLHQSIVTDCSLVASLAACLDHHSKFRSKLGISCLHPQDAGGLPILSDTGKYQARLHCNGIQRKIDDRLPCGASNSLLCLSTRGATVFLPSLIEKAYMKLNGGYDFPGSDSSIDIYALTGWIPETLTFRSPSFRRELTWNRVKSAFSQGLCVITLGTNQQPPSRFIAFHAYAIVDLQEHEDIRTVRVLNPWSVSSEPPAEWIPPGIIVLDWDAVCESFESLYVNWDPAQFQHHTVFHGLWRSNDLTANGGLNNQFQLRLRSEEISENEEAEVWCLLTRHVRSTKRRGDFITLHHLPNYSKTLHSTIKGLSYTGSPHTLSKFSVGCDATQLIASLHSESVQETGFSLVVYSPKLVWLEGPPQLPFTKKITGSLSIGSSGGNSMYPSFMNNPQYTVDLTGSGSTSVQLNLRLEGSKDAPLNVMLVWRLDNDGRVTDMTTGDIVFDSGPYSYGFALASGTLKRAIYSIIVSGFEPKVRTPFTLSIECSHKFDVRAVPPEGAGMFPKSIKGHWIGDSAAGPPSQRSYHKNPAFRIILKEPSRIIIRLQRSNPNSRTPINIALFVNPPTTFSSNIPPPLLSSGGYSQLASGVVATSSLSKGTYYLVPSTSRAGAQEGFVLFFYSTDTPISVEPI